LRVEMAGRGSPLYALTWRHWDMPAGPPICALRASGLRTSASASTGWPTPRTQDEKPSLAGRKATINDKGRVVRESGQDFSMALCDAAQLAGWPTPNAGPQNDTDQRWEARREECKATHGNNGFGLTLGMASQLATLGPHPGCIPAETGSAVPCRLNPLFSLWLMGFPPSWAETAPPKRSPRGESGC